jgi:signal recognition particle subunit SRP54
MFDALSERFERLGASLRSRGRLTDADLDDAFGEVRSALLEADVELGVVRAFLDAVRVRLSGEALSQSLSPGQQVIKAVHEQLIEVLGGSALKVTYASKPPTVVLLAGLQGAGKTTTAAKLASWFKQQGRQPYLSSCECSARRSASTCSPSRRTHSRWRDAGSPRRRDWVATW